MPVARRLFTIVSLWTRRPSNSPLRELLQRRGEHRAGASRSLAAKARIEDVPLPFRPTNNHLHLTKIPLKARSVFWIYHANDLRELRCPESESLGVRSPHDCLPRGQILQQVIHVIRVRIRQ